MSCGEPWDYISKVGQCYVAIATSKPKYWKLVSRKVKLKNGWGAWIPSQAKFLNDFNKSFFHIRQMCHRFVLQLAHGVKGHASTVIISARCKNATPPR